MFHSSLSRKVAAFILGLSVAVSPAFGATVQGEVTADNTFMINVSYGAGQTSTVVPATGSWNSAESVSFHIDETRLHNCTIQIVAWNDNSFLFTNVAGLIGHLSGNNGTMVTGSSAIGLYQTNISSVGGGAALNASNFENWMAAPSQTPTHVSTFLQNFWWAPNGLGSIGFSQTPTGMQWVWDSASTWSGHSDYLSFSFPCSAVVTDFPAPPPGPFDEDHFSCYKPIKVENAPSEVELFIRDQFGESAIVIGQPVLHCNPSTKHHNGQDFDIENRERHLVCYDIIKQDTVFPPAVEITNQIEVNRYTSDQEREMFCVPSKKREL